MPYRTSNLGKKKCIASTLWLLQRIHRKRLAKGDCLTNLHPALDVSTSVFHRVTKHSVLGMNNSIPNIRVQHLQLQINQILAFATCKAGIFKAIYEL